MGVPLDKGHQRKLSLRRCYLSWNLNNEGKPCIRFRGSVPGREDGDGKGSDAWGREVASSDWNGV